MLSLKPLIAHLEPKPVGFVDKWFRQVGGAAQYAQLRPEALPLPACWLVRAAERSRHAGEGAEDLTIGFDVVIAVENVRSAVDADELLLHYRQAVKTLLLGWEMAPEVKPIKYEGGRVLEYTDGDLYWADRYVFDALITNWLPDPSALFDSLNLTGVNP